MTPLFSFKMFLVFLTRPKWNVFSQAILNLFLLQVRKVPGCSYGFMFLAALLCVDGSDSTKGILAC